MTEKPYKVTFTTFLDNGDSYLTQSHRYGDEERAIEMAYNIISTVRWVNVRVTFESSKHMRPKVVFDWKFYNQPEWAQHVLNRIGKAS